MSIENWLDITFEAVSDLWRGFLEFIPNLIGAFLVLIIGWLFAMVIGKLVSETLVRIKLNQFFERTGWKAALEKAELKVNPAEFIGAIVKWVLVIVFLSAAVEILGLKEFAGILRDILAYLPNVVVAALILVVTVILVDIVEKVVRATVEGMKVGYGHLVSVIIKWSLWVFAILAILYHLGIAKPFMEFLFKGIVATFVLAFGISFGLGGKEVAAEILQEFRKKLKR